MTIDISNNDPRISYTVGAGVTQTSFAVPFEFFDDSDVNVYVNEVLKTITTDYTISGGDGSTGTVTISVTGPATVTLTRDITIERVTDFPTGIDINRAALNTQLDTLTAIAADLKDEITRNIRISDADTATNLTLPSASNRADKVLSFDTEGNVQTQNASDLFSGSILGANYVNNTATGDGSTVAFGVSVAPGSKNNIQIYIDGVYQNKATFSISGTTVTFSEAPPLNAAIEFIIGSAVTSISGDADGITYTQGGTGSQQRTVESKLQEFVSVKDFGAVGDGVADDTAAIQAALDTKTSKVYLPSGAYVTSSTIKVYPDQMLVGDGNNMSIIQSSVSGSAGYENYVPCVAAVDANGSYALDAKDLQNHTHFRDFRIVNTGAYSIGLLYAGAFRGGVRNVSIEGDSGVSAGSRTSLGLVITGLNKASNRGCYYSYFESVYARYQKVGVIYGNRCHSHGPLTDIQAQFCDIGLRQDNGSDFNFNASYLSTPVTMVLMQADIEVIDGNAIDNLIANNTTIIGTYIDSIGGNGIETQSGNTTILNTYYTSITGSDVNRVGGNIDGINTGVDVGVTIPRVTDGNEALQVGPILNDSDVRVNTPNQRLISGSVDITGTGSSSTASATVTFASLGLPTNIYMAGVWVQVISSTTGGASNSLYNAVVSGPILFGSDTAFDIHIRDVTGSNISASETVTVRWFAIAYTV